MADVILGPAGSIVVVDLHTCVKTGRPTTQRVTLRGQTTPAWVTVLLLFTIIGFLIAGAMTSRRYRVTLPFEHDAHDRWRKNRLAARGVALVGAGALVAALTITPADPGLGLGLGVAFVTGGLIIGIVNAWVNNVGTHTNADGNLVLTRAHPAFAEKAQAATIEPFTR